jgi:hypothetical protein
VKTGDDLVSLTPEQKQWPQGRVTGPSNSSPQIVHRKDPSMLRRPGASTAGGKSVGSGTSARRKSFAGFVSSLIETPKGMVYTEMLEAARIWPEYEHGTLNAVFSRRLTQFQIR